MISFLINIGRIFFKFVALSYMLVVHALYRSDLIIEQEFIILISLLEA